MSSFSNYPMTANYYGQESAGTSSSAIYLPPDTQSGEEYDGNEANICSSESYMDMGDSNAYGNNHYGYSGDDEIDAQSGAEQDDYLNTDQSRVDENSVQQPSRDPPEGEDVDADDDDGDPGGVALDDIGLPLVSHVGPGEYTSGEEDDYDEQDDLAGMNDTDSTFYINPNIMSFALLPDNLDAPVPMPPNDVGNVPSAVLNPPAFTGALYTAPFHLPPAMPPQMSPLTVGSLNLGLWEFLYNWSLANANYKARSSLSPRLDKVQELAKNEGTPQRVDYADLQGDKCDFQGINWVELGIDRTWARERRLNTYKNYVNVPGSDRWNPGLPDLLLPRADSFFRFRRMYIRQNVHLAHFQLRNLLAATSRARVFYPILGAVQQFNPLSNTTRNIMRLNEAPPAQISAMDAAYGVLVAGGFNGEYVLRHLDTDEPESTACHEGIITTSVSGITNHIAIQLGRSSSPSNPRAAFASNDTCFRILDLATETWLQTEKFDYAINCTALSPDRRMRVLVGDERDVLITADEPRSDGTPNILYKLSAHRDFGFACDWADDGWTIATGFQDKTVQIWDARRLVDSRGSPQPVCVLRSEMVGVRSLKFSPVGSGPRVLVAAEEADFINIIDARSWRSKQTFDVFGELAGTVWVDGGQGLYVLCADRHRGGIIYLERCYGSVRGLEQDGVPEDGMVWETEESAEGDWRRNIFTEEKRSRHRAWRGRRRPVGHVDMGFF